MIWISEILSKNRNECISGDIYVIYFVFQVDFTQKWYRDWLSADDCRTTQNQTSDECKFISSIILTKNLDIQLSLVDSCQTHCSFD